MSAMRVLLADDHSLFKEGLRNLLNARGIEVAGSAGDGYEALELARQLHPDVILMDIQMPRCDGLEATRLIKTEMPDINIVMLTTAADDNSLFEAIKSGASGYLLKNLDADHFFELLSNVAQGEPAISPDLAQRILNEFAQRKASATHSGSNADGPERLTDRQLEVLQQVVGGNTYREIAATLSITERTVKYHMREILQKLHLQNKAQVIAYALRTGLVADKTDSPNLSTRSPLE
jgi:DNA-binding NarL/FixJ family response regulator